ncbi:hypothetical protein ZHAS_00010939 [Anopheles sinensis]|uniref:Uncharacterized protein n=1 Tax=Anopheles sinensis TaxID=74873 RepID=A0A084VYX2_ANOSI|nr:hypothetical protein ZHAS_00010939 [Anopheles sinensis]
MHKSHLKTTTSTTATTTTVRMLQTAPENLQKKAGLNASESNGASSLPVPMQTTTNMLATVVTILINLKQYTDVEIRNRRLHINFIHS